jgi:hypothetical protein
MSFKEIFESKNKDRVRVGVSFDLDDWFNYAEDNINPDAFDDWDDMEAVEALETYVSKGVKNIVDVDDDDENNMLVFTFKDARSAEKAVKQFKKKDFSLDVSIL